jgi:hypothetical protein
MEERSIKKLLTSIKCSSCGRRYERRNIDVLGHRDDMWFLSVFCPACRTQYLIVAVVTREKVQEVITDLTEAELEKFRGAGAVTADEVLDMHGFLKVFNGNFSRLFEREQV